MRRHAHARAKRSGTDVVRPRPRRARLVHVAQDHVHRLLRGDDAEPSEPGDVVFGNGLDVLEPVPAAARRGGVDRRGLLERVERHPDGTIADRVDLHLEPALIEHRDNPLQILRREVRRAGGRAVRIRCQHRRRPALDDAISEQLHDAGPDAGVLAQALPGLHHAVRIGFRRRGVGRKGEIGTDGQAPVAFRRLERGDLLDAAAGVLHAGDPELVGMGHGCFQRRGGIRLGWLRQHRIQEIGRGFLQVTGRLTGPGVLHDLAVRRVRRVFRDTGSR